MDALSWAAVAAKPLLPIVYYTQLVLLLSPKKKI